MAQIKSSKQLAKFIAYILERRPDEFGLVLDSEGYVKIKQLLKAITEEEGWRHVRRTHLDEIMITIREPAFEISDHLIRAKIRQHLPKNVLAQNLPKLLYTCVRQKAYPFVIEKGIFPLGYPQVILSNSGQMAERIGKRIDQVPVMLTVQVQHSIEKGVVYYQTGEALYLAEFIPAGCFTGPPLPKEKAAPKKAEMVDKAVQPSLAGSFLIDLEQRIQPGTYAFVKKVDKKTDRKKSKKHERKRQPPPWRR